MFEQPITNFSGGEVSEEIFGRYDSELFKNGLRRCENFLSLTQGALLYRGSTTHMHSTRLQSASRLESFQYNDEQGYVLEFTDAKLRIYEDDALTLNSTAKNITAATKANPCQVTAVGHGLATNDEIYISGVGGMTELNGRFFRVVKVDNDNVTLKDLYGTAINSTNYTTYTAGGTLKAVYEVTSPYAAADLFDFQCDQEGNDMTFTHDGYAPYRLTRVSSTSWTFATFVRTNDPFTGAGEYPRSCAYFAGGLYYGGSINHPNRWWRSRGPDATGASRYDDFTTGADADHAIIKNLNTARGKVPYIHWIEPLDGFIAFGTEGGIVGLDGGGDAAITPTNFRVRPIDPVGVRNIRPVSDGQTLFYVQKGGKTLRSFEYDILADKYKSFNRSFVAPHLLKSRIKRIAIQRWKIDFIWVLRNDGILACLTVKPKEDPSGWHRHTIGGNGVTVLDVIVQPQADDYDKAYMVVERTINGTTTRHVEFLNNPWEGLDKNDYYTADESADNTAYINEMYEAQRDARCLDASLVWDGSDRGAITLTPGALTGTGITFTASAGVFTSADVGKLLTKRYQDRAGGGQAIITAYTDTTHVVCTIQADFDAVTAIPAGDWFMSSDSITGAYHLEGQTIQVVADGRIHSDVTVASGVVALTRQASVVVIGYKYRGIAIPLPLVFLGQLQNSMSFVKNIGQLAITMANTIGVKYGTSLYELQEIYAFEEGSLTNRPPLPFTGTKPLSVEDSWGSDKSVVYVQDAPYPCTLNAMNVSIEIGEK